MDEQQKIKFETLSHLFKKQNQAHAKLTEALDQVDTDENSVSTFSKQLTFHLRKFRKSYETLSEDEKLKFHEFLKKTDKK